MKTKITLSFTISEEIIDELVDKLDFEYTHEEIKNTIPEAIDYLLIKPSIQEIYDEVYYMLK